MARKDGSTLRGREKAAQRPGQLTLPESYKSDRVRASKSWAAIGVDTSMTSIAVVGIGYDSVLDKMVGPQHTEVRWLPETDYYKRLSDAAKAHELILDVVHKLWVINPANVFIAIEEPFFYGAVKRQQSSWLKQQAEVSGAFKGGLARYGYLNIYEINNAQWAKALREEGVLVYTNRKDPDRKWKVKEWAIQAFGLPDLPDLVASKSGAKIIRPESGYGAKAKPVQPNDIYDAAACCAWMMNEIESGRVKSPHLG
jgi:hypothetical protein